MIQPAVKLERSGEMAINDCRRKMPPSHNDGAMNEWSLGEGRVNEPLIMIKADYASLPLASSVGPPQSTYLYKAVANHAEHNSTSTYHHYSHGSNSFSATVHPYLRYTTRSS